MFTKKVLSGSLGFVIALLGGDVVGAIAQNYNRSEKFLSDLSIQMLDSEFQRATKGISGRGYRDTRQASQVNQLNQFVSAWQKTEPSIASFLGNWIGGEESLAIYPSTRKGFVCVVHSSYGRDGFEYNFNIGKPMGNKLVSDGQLGKIIILKKTAPDKEGNTVDFLGSFRSYRNLGVVSAYVFPTTLKPISDSRFTRLGCTASLPF